MGVQLDGKTFFKRIARISPKDLGVSCVLVCVGAAQEDQALKSVALQMWLLGYEFPETLIAVCASGKIVLLSSQKKAAILESLKQKDSDDRLVILTRSKVPEESEKIWQQVADLLGDNIGVLPKDVFQGKFYDEYKRFIKAEKTDVSLQLSLIIANKDDSELKLIDTAARLSTLVMKNYVVAELETILDEERKITHAAFSDKIEEALEESYRKRLKISADVSFDAMDWAYPPIVQSGGKYDLRPSASSNRDKLHAGVIIASIGVKYKSYSSNVARTFLIDPERPKEKNYKFLLEVHDYCVAQLRPGTPCKNVHAKVVAYVDSKRPDLAGHLPKNFGFGMGLEFRESLFVLGPKSSREVKAGMIFNVAIGFQDLENDGETAAGRTYALLVSDTVRVDADRNVTLTADVTRTPSDISYIFKDPVAAPAADGGDAEDRLKTIKPSAILDTKTRGAGKGGQKKAKDASAEVKRREHQAELARLKQEEGLARFQGLEDEAAGESSLMFKKYASYKRETALPNETRDLRLLVDRRNLSVIVPIYGLAVPFHVNTIKNITKTDDRDHVYLRLNFQTPGQTLAKKDATSLPYDDPDATFIRSLTFKSTDVYRFNELYREISDLKKDVQKRANEQKVLAGLVEQGDLVELRGKRPTRLGDIFVRPAMDGKKFPGELEIHVNGLRYLSQVRNDQKIDILFSNIKHFFFQPCNHELLVLVHIHLRDAIMIGKKQTKDVQFYREVADANFDETGNRRRRYNYGDEDELMAEQEERKQRHLLNREFKEFSQKVAEASKDSVSVDVPYRDLGFHGVPVRQLVLMQPTTDCLVHLSEPPFTVITLADIEVAHLERVQFGLKNFDLVIVFRDFKVLPLHINTIPTDQLDNVKEWLDSVDIPFTEGPVNLSWPQIMKTIREAPADFFKEGGWGFLRLDSDAEDSSESASEFEGSNGGGFGEDAASSSDFSSEEDGSGFSSGSGSAPEDDESGEDWDDLEAKAREKDERKRGHGSDDSDDGGGAKRRR